MKVLSAPKGIKRSLLGAFLFPFIVTGQAVLYRPEWLWTQPERNLLPWLGVSLLVIVIFSLFILNGSLFARRAFEVSALIWILFTLAVGVGAHRFWLSLSALPLTGIAAIVTRRLRDQWDRASFDPHCPWYARVPDPLPELSASIKGFDCRLSRLDSDGLFVFSDQNGRDGDFRNWVKTLRARDRVPIAVALGGESVSCSGRPIRLLRDDSGVGFEFVFENFEQEKRLGDLIERARGRGYVA